MPHLLIAGQLYYESTQAHAKVKTVFTHVVPAQSVTDTISSHLVSTRRLLTNVLTLFTNHYSINQVLGG